MVLGGNFCHTTHGAILRIDREWYFFLDFDLGELSRSFTEVWPNIFPTDQDGYPTDVDQKETIFFV